MISITNAKRIIKRIILANLVNEKKDLALTPLLCGKHGIGKSQIIKSIATDINGICVTIEGGTLKEGEITGLPYQYKNENGEIKFKFLPYYAIDRIMAEEKKLFIQKNGNVSDTDNLLGDENAYSMNDIPSEEKIKMIKNKEIRPVLIFIDEINRTENTVYKELMNILLTRSVNGYELPWWVFFVGAMNPSSQNSTYSTNEMDPAQLDRFFKIIVSDDVDEWIKYSERTNVDKTIIEFIKSNPKCLSDDSKEYEDEEKPIPSPRGWDMVDSIKKSVDQLKCFFTDEENESTIELYDLKTIFNSKLGVTAATMYFTALDKMNLKAEDIFYDDVNLTKCKSIIMNMSAPQKVQLCDLVVKYLEKNINIMLANQAIFENNKKKLSKMIYYLDSPAKLMLAQKITKVYTEYGESLIDLIYDVFEKDLLKTVNISENAGKVING